MLFPKSTFKNRRIATVESSLVGSFCLLLGVAIALPGFATAAEDEDQKDKNKNKVEIKLTQSKTNGYAPATIDFRGYIRGIKAEELRCAKVKWLIQGYYRDDGYTPNVDSREEFFNTRGRTIDAQPGGIFEYETLSDTIIKINCNLKKGELPTTDVSYKHNFERAGKFRVKMLLKVGDKIYKSKYALVNLQISGRRIGGE